MHGTTRALRRALGPVLVFAAVAGTALWALDIRLAPGVGLAVVASAAAAASLCAWWLHRSDDSRCTAAMRDAVEPLQRASEGHESSSASAGPDDPISAIRALADRAADRIARLEGDHDYLLTVLGSMSEGVLVVDAEGRTVLVNRSWRTLFDVSGEVEGRTVLEVTRQTELDRLIAEALETGVGRQIELEVTLPRRLTVILTSSPLTDGAGVVVLATDLTPFLRVSQIRRDFVANVSHELKTPLSAIRGFAETLNDGALEDPAAARRFTERILKQCQRLEALLSDLLTLSRLEHSAARAEWTELDMAAVMHEAIDLTEEAVAERRLRLVADSRPVPGLRGDSEAMLRLCLNLLENAIKYNRPEGRVEARLEGLEDRIVLEIADTGIGIPAESIERLFERFYRVDKGRSRNEGGTGLGLAIVKHAAQLHGGSVTVESELGKGTRFRVTLPLGPAFSNRREIQ